MADHNPSPDLSMGLQCPIPISDYPTVMMAHGGGGRLIQMLIDRMFVPTFDNPTLETLHDGAILEANGSRLAFSTDSFVINPIFFPGGDIGSLAVHGTVNDLAMCGARPLGLSTALILEEGLPMEDLWRVVQSMQQAAGIAGVPIVTGDTKVVERGKGDGIFINTTGLGLIPAGVRVSPARAQPGDMVLINGAIAVHGRSRCQRRWKRKEKCRQYLRRQVPFSRSRSCARWRRRCGRNTVNQRNWLSLMAGVCRRLKFWISRPRSSSARRIICSGPGLLRRRWPATGLRPRWCR